MRANLFNIASSNACLAEGVINVYPSTQHQAAFEIQLQQIITNTGNYIGEASPIILYNNGVSIGGYERTSNILFVITSISNGYISGTFTGTADPDAGNPKLDITEGVFSDILLFWNPRCKNIFETLLLSTINQVEDLKHLTTLMGVDEKPHTRSPDTYYVTGLFDNDAKM